MKYLSSSITILIVLISWNTMMYAQETNKESKDFLSKVRYIIIDEERSMFKEYPPEEREEFIEKFWARRDPTPLTEKNEFKEQFYLRMEEADKLFTGGIAGWLQDRGRVYLILGPPDERVINPEGREIDLKTPSTMGKPLEPGKEPAEPPRPGEMRVEPKEQGVLGKRRSETWVYYNPPITSQPVKLQFVDRTGTGNLKLATDIEFILAPVIKAFVSPNFVLINKTNGQIDQAALTAALLKKRVLFNFKWKFIKKKSKDSNLLIHVEAPYRRILLGKKDDLYSAEMNIFMEIRDDQGKLVWDFYNTFDLSLTEDKLKAKKDRQWELDIPVTYLLSKGEYSVYIHLSNYTANQEVKKLLSLKM